MDDPMDAARPLSIFRICALSATLLLAGCGDDDADAGAAPPATIVVLAEVAPVEWRDTLEALGTARANESVTLTAKVSETVRKVGFDSGDIVRAGDVIVDLSSGAQLAGLEEARAAYQEAERQLARGQELAQKQLISASQLDTQR
jgi:membrane fusion protein (multidrug efflux system)